MVVKANGSAWGCLRYICWTAFSSKFRPRADGYSTGILDSMFFPAILLPLRIIVPSQISFHSNSNIEITQKDERIAQKQEDFLEKGGGRTSSDELVFGNLTGKLD